jgi:hypothetical protein
MRSIQVKGDGCDHQRIYALMVFPEDSRFRQSYLQMLIDHGAIPADSEAIQIERWDAPRWAEMKEKAQKAVRSGILAGDFFVTRAIMDAQGLREPSTRKALQAIEHFHKGKRYADGKLIRPSPRKIEGRDMGALSSVAHLWAAFSVFRTDYGKDHAREKIRTKRGLQRLLRLAAYFQRFGLEAVTPRTNQRRIRPLLDPTQLWRVPASIKPISVEQLPTFKPEMLNSIKSYSYT